MSIICTLPTTDSIEQAAEIFLTKETNDSVYTFTAISPVYLMIHFEKIVEDSEKEYYESYVHEIINPITKRKELVIMKYTCVYDSPERKSLLIYSRLVEKSQLYPVDKDFALPPKYDKYKEKSINGFPDRWIIPILDPYMKDVWVIKDRDTLQFVWIGYITSNREYFTSHESNQINTHELLVRTGDLLNKMYKDIPYFEDFAGMVMSKNKIVVKLSKKNIRNTSEMFNNIFSC